MPDHVRDDNLRRLEQLAKRAKELDDVIKRAAEMQKRIVDEIRQLGRADRPARQRPPTQTAKRRRARAKRR